MVSQSHEDCNTLELIRVTPFGNSHTFQNGVSHTGAMPRYATLLGGTGAYQGRQGRGDGSCFRLRIPDLTDVSDVVVSCRFQRQVWEDSGRLKKIWPFWTRLDTEKLGNFTKLWARSCSNWVTLPCRMQLGVCGQQFESWSRVAWLTNIHHFGAMLLQIWTLPRGWGKFSCLINYIINFMHILDGVGLPSFLFW